MFDFKRLRIFVTLAEKAHFGKAAAALNMSQPPLSRQIMALEQELGVQLFERNARQVVLTPAGQQLLKDARPILDQLASAARNARLAADGAIGELTLGFMMMAANTVVPRLVRRMKSDFPDIVLTLKELVPGELVDDIAGGQVDVGILLAPIENDSLATVTVFCDPLKLVVPNGHPFAGRIQVSVNELKDQSLIATPRWTSPALRRQIEDYCGAAGFAAPIHMEVQLQQTILNMVAEGLGVALVPASLGRQGFRSVTFVDLSAGPITRQIAAWRPDNPNPSLGKLLSVVNELDVSGIGGSA